MEPLHKEGITVHCILGNHDTYYKNTNNLNSSEELFGSRYNKFHIYSDPVEVSLGDMCVAMIPWINKENKDNTLKFLKKTKCQIVAGHFELNGYQVMRGVKMDGGMDDFFLLGPPSSLFLRLQSNCFFLSLFASLLGLRVVGTFKHSSTHHCCTRA